MKKVKLSVHGNSSLLSRLTPGKKGAWRDFQFYINDELEECDWWAVYDGLSKEETALCPSGRKVFVTAEPPAIKKYAKGFLDQFDLILTSQPNIKGENVIHGQTGLPWTLYTQNKDGTIDLGSSKTYDDLKKNAGPKTKLFSAVTSNKRWTKGHRERLDFIEKIQKHFGDHVDVFGPGQGVVPVTEGPIRFKYHENKWEALAGYKYHLAIENSVCPDYWSEKIADAYLADSYPIYFGCPNITDYFPADSLTVIDIRKPDEAIKKIEGAITDKAFEKSVEARKKAKELILEKYQIFPLLTEMMVKNKKEGSKISATIRPESHFIKISMIRRAKDKLKRGLIKTTRWTILKLANLGKIDLLFLGYNKIGVLNFKNPKVSGEEFFMKQVLPKLLGKTDPVFFDVGAHAGEYSSLLRKEFPSARILSFEPNTGPFKTLAETAQKENLEAHHMGLSSTSGDAEIFFNKEDSQNQLASLYQGVIDDLHRSQSAKAKIKLVRLDDFCKENSINRIDFLKIDTEGHELEVLKGATKMLAENKITVIQFEFNEMNVISRVFLKDFYDLLHNFDLYRLGEKGLLDIRKYDGSNEIFKFQNIVALPKHRSW